MEQTKGLTLNQLKRRDRLHTAFEHRTPRITKKALARECHYGERYISHFFAGTRPLTDTAAEVLAPVLHVRKEYLLGIDNVMTDKDFEKRKEFTDAFTELIEFAVKQTVGKFEYRFIRPTTDLSEYNDLDDWDLDVIKKSQSEGYHSIVKVTDDPYGDEEYEVSVVDDDSYYRLARDICDFITLRVAHTFDDNYMRSFMYKMDMVMPLLRGK